MRILTGWLVVIMTIGFMGCPPIPVASNSVSVYNYSNEIINAIYISPTYANDWGYNQINNYLFPGESIRIYNIPNDCYDILVVGEYSVYWDVYEVCLYGGDNFSFTVYDKKELEIMPFELDDLATYQEPYTPTEPK